MPQGIMVPVTGQGTIVDQNVATYLPTLVTTPFGFKDVYIYSHGWWTTAQAAMVDYSRFSIGMLAQVLRSAEAAPVAAPPNPALEVGIHWPSMISEDSNSVIDVLQPLTFYNRAAMADDVGQHGGQSIIRLILQGCQAGVSLRFHLLGHSFGCRIVCSALNELLNQIGSGPLQSHQFDVVLLQGAIDNDSLQTGGSYEKILAPGGIPNIRLLISKSSQDTALCKWYPDAYRLVHLFGRHPDAIGGTGPTPATPGASGALSLSVGPGFQPPASVKASKFVIADLTPLHSDGTVPTDSFSGHHSDIYRDEIYRLLAAFL